MISVRKEWRECNSDEELLAWAKKWGTLLMEDFQNPIWTSGYTNGQKSILNTLEAIRDGKDVDSNEDVINAYKSAIDIISSKLKIVSFNIQATEEALHTLDQDELTKIAAEEMSKQLAKYINMDVEELDNNMVNFSFTLVMVDD
ncbi:hypothetical protein EBZ38_07345 [bacterium]|nr:hypothetical protein [bacterium]